MALHTRWSSGDLIFYDGTQDIFTIKNSTGGILVGEDNLGIDFTFYGATTLAYLKWDESNDTLVSELSDLTFYGSSTGSGIKFDSSADLIDFDGINITYPTPQASTSTTGANITLTSTSNRIQFLSSTANFNLIIPDSSGTGVAGIKFDLFKSSGGTCTVCEGDTGTVIVTVGAFESAIVASNATEWRYILGTSS